MLASCVLYGSGIRVVEGTLSGTVPVNAKIGLFPNTDSNTFLYDQFNNGDPDVIYQNKIGAIVGTFIPVLLVSPASGNSYSITLPEEPSTIKCLIAWDDINGDDIFDIGTESGYLPVKSINGTSHVVKSFSYIDVTEVITYIVNYSNLSYTETHEDNFDAIGADGFNFVFD